MRDVVRPSGEPRRPPVKAVADNKAIAIAAIDVQIPWKGGLAPSMVAVAPGPRRGRSARWYKHKLRIRRRITVLPWERDRRVKSSLSGFVGR